MKQLYTLDSMVDRQITRVENWGDVMYIFFHDDTFIQFNGGSEYITEDDYGIDYLNICETPIDMEAKYALYLISSEEFEAWKDEVEKKNSETNRDQKMNKLKKLAEELNVQLPNL